jgi:WD40 repeat protein
MLAIELAKQTVRSIRLEIPVVLILTKNISLGKGTSGIFIRFIQNPKLLELSWQGRANDLITDLAWSPIETSWAAGTANGEVVWNISGEELTCLKSADDRSIDKIAFSADGNWLAAGGRAGKLYVWNCVDRQIPPQLVRTIEIDRWIEQLVWHPTAPHLVISYDRHIQIWDASAERELSSWQFERSSVFALQWHPDGSVITAAGYKGVEICSFPNADKIDRLATDTASIQLAWSTDGCYLAAANLDRTITLMDRQQPEAPWILQGCPGKIRHLHWLEGVDSPCLAVASGTELLLWELHIAASDWRGWSGSGHQSNITALTAHPQFAIPTSGDNDGYICLWSIGGEIDQICRNAVSGITTLDWHSRGQYLACGYTTGAIEVWVASA